MGPEPCCSQCFFSHFGSHFRKKWKKSEFCGSGAIFPLLGAKICFFAKKAGNHKNAGKSANHVFSPEAPNPLKRKHLGTFLEPETHKCVFSTFGLTFPSWGGFGAKSAPEVGNGQDFAFLRPKVENRVFAILVEKRCPERYVYKGFCASDRKV